jgi:hypothetical protein
MLWMPWHIDVTYSNVKEWRGFGRLCMYLYLFVCVCVCVCVRARAHARLCVDGCVYVCVRAYTHKNVFILEQSM